MKTILVDAVGTFVNKEGEIFEPLHELLEKYPNRKIILTNADDEQMLKFGLDKVPYEVFTLKHSPDKVDPEYFRTMLKHFDLSADDVVYFEHSPEAVESARSVGIESHHYDPAEKDLNAVEGVLRDL